MGVVEGKNTENQLEVMMEVKLAERVCKPTQELSRRNFRCLSIFVSFFFAHLERSEIAEKKIEKIDSILGTRTLNVEENLKIHVGR